MSFLNPTESKLSNPVTKWGEYRGGSGEFRFWDKSQPEGQEQSIESEIMFMPIFIFSGVAGFSEALGGGLYSNEVKNASDILTVRCNKLTEPVAVGTWQEIKPEIERVKGSYAKIAYGVRFFSDKKGNTNHELVVIKIFGSAIGGWIDARVFEADRRPLTLSKGEAKKKGNVSYFSMAVKKEAFDSGLVEIATPYAIELDSYFKSYFGQEVEESPNTSQMLESAPEALQIADKSVLDIDAEFAEASEDVLPF